MSAGGGWSRRAKLHAAAVEDVRAIAVVAALPADVQARLAERCLAGTYPRDELIEWWDEGDVALGVVTGAVEISLESGGGRKASVLWLGAGQVAELEGAGWGPPDATVATVVSAEAAFMLIPLSAFWQAVHACAAAVTLLRAEDRRIRRALGALASNQLHPRPASRIDHEIWREGEDAAGRPLVMSQELLATRARTTQPAVSREIKRLIEDGVIAFDRKAHQITVLHPERLIDEE